MTEVKSEQWIEEHQERILAPERLVGELLLSC